MAPKVPMPASRDDPWLIRGMSAEPATPGLTIEGRASVVPDADADVASIHRALHRTTGGRFAFLRRRIRRT